MARPKPTGESTLQTISMQFRAGILNKLNYVTWFDRRASRRAVLEEALEDYLSKWEKKNGPITSDLMREMEEAMK